MKETTSKRLRRIMNEKNLKQVELLELIKPVAEKYNIKFGKSHLSMYLSGKAIPKQDKLVVLAEALNVSEVYLMGFNEDVAIENPIKQASEDVDLLFKFSQLNEENKKTICNLIDMMILNQNGVGH